MILLVLAGLFFIINVSLPTRTAPRATRWGEPRRFAFGAGLCVLGQCTINALLLLVSDGAPTAGPTPMLAPNVPGERATIQGQAETPTPTPVPSPAALPTASPIGAPAMDPPNSPATVAPSPTGPPPAPSTLTRDESLAVSGRDLASLVSGTRDFALALYPQAAGEGYGNLFITPYSISPARAMTCAGVGRKTEEQMADSLSFVLDQAGLQAAFNAQDQELNCRAMGEDYGASSRTLPARCGSRKGTVSCRISWTLWL